jgi:hypothetical protein
MVEFAVRAHAPSDRVNSSGRIVLDAVGVAASSGKTNTLVSSRRIGVVADYP